nr:MAG TPA: hypothetical protein [Caudoviricetes sp.]
MCNRASNFMFSSKRLKKSAIRNSKTRFIF